MNKLTSLKYMEMKDISINISRNLQDLNQKCETVAPVHEINANRALVHEIFQNQEGEIPNQMFIT